MSACVFDAIEAGVPLVAGGVVDRIDVKRLYAKARAQVIDECLSGRSAWRGCLRCV